MACLHDHSEDHDYSSGWTLYEHIDLPKVQILCLSPLVALNFTIPAFFLLYELSHCCSIWVGLQSA
ncbi:hypothetical protein C1H46_045679 [Malus baccata]|uniref:Uncharacterized protein n=1 Tax=Malus baccata TaxID=106549 RepID=A0A540K3H5_MALBA|nr:hypothetical protein C1H46_045679 [Malus baccata]